MGRTDAPEPAAQGAPPHGQGGAQPDLKAAFTGHLEVTRSQVARLERIFEKIGGSPKGKRCVVMEGLIEKGKGLLEQKEAEPSVPGRRPHRAAQRVEHYEMAGCGCIRTFAKLLGHTDARKLLQETLAEEAEADEKGTRSCPVTAGAPRPAPFCAIVPASAGRAAIHFRPREPPAHP